MTYSNNPSRAALKSINDVSHTPFWLDDPQRPQSEPELTREHSTELLIIGGGFTGLWTALLAKEEIQHGMSSSSREAKLPAAQADATADLWMNPSRTGCRTGWRVGRKEFPALLALGMDNLDSIEATIRRLNIECDFLRARRCHRGIRAVSAGGDEGGDRNCKKVRYRVRVLRS
jgi:hypothetical protein